MSKRETFAAFGLLATLLVAVVAELELAATYLVMAAFVHVPLAMRLIRPDASYASVGATDSGDDGATSLAGRLWMAIDRAWPPAALALGLSAILESSAAAGALAVIWLVFTVLVAGYGAARLLARGLRDLSETAIDAGALLLPIGGAWTVAWRLDMTVMGFEGIWVLLTAVHFHYAAFLLPVIVGAFGRLEPKRRLVEAVVIVSAIPLTAIGIATVQTVEFAAAWTLALGATAFALRLVVRPKFAVAGIALVAAMVLAAGYATATTLGLSWLDLEEMIVWHGSANALAFALVALFVLVRLDPRPAPGVDQVAFSRLRGDFRIGADYFERVGATGSAHASGLVDRLDELDGPDFSAVQVASPIQDFYEQTGEFDLEVEAHWKWWFAWAGRIWHRVAVRMEQTVFPVGQSSRADERTVASEIVALDASIDGRPAPRAWVRTFVDDGKAMYAAAYSTHRFEDVGYMNIAFPMWRSNMASVLVPENLGADGLRLDTRTTAARPHAGIWQVTGLGPIRLPLREYIDVWMADDPDRPDDLAPGDAPMVARHVLTAWGIHYLTLDYRMRPGAMPGT